MQRVVVLGPGAAGKSTFSARLAEATGLPLIELDRLFWDDALRPTPTAAWRAMQVALAAGPAWILDGDLGPYDVLGPRLESADTVFVLDVSRWRCAWRALRRSHERLEFWTWLWRWRRHFRPSLMHAITARAPTAAVHRPRTPAAVERLTNQLIAQSKNCR